MKTLNINNKERFAIHAKAIINGYKDLAVIWNAIITVSNEMNGKVFNKRFTDSVNAKIDGVGRVSASDPYNLGHKTLNIYLFNRSYCLEGAGCIYYDDELYFTSLHDVDDILTDGRIAADKANYHLSKIIELINNKIATYSDALKNYDKYMNKRAKALEAFGKAMAGLNKLFEYGTLNSYDWQRAAEKAK